MTEIIGLLSTNGYIICNKTIIKLFGADCAILLGELCAEYKYFEMSDKLVDGMFYSTYENIEENTGLSKYYIMEAIKKLKNEGVLDVTKMGIPAKNYYKLNDNKLSEIFTTSSLKFRPLEVENLDHYINNNKENNNKENNILSKDNNNFTESEFESKMYLPEKKKRGKSLYEKCLDYIDEFTDLPELKAVLIEYLKFRLNVKDKPLYNINQWKSMLKKLDDVVAECKVEYAVIVQQSIDKAWLNFYALTKSNKKDVFAEGSGLSCERSKEDKNERKEILKKQGKRTEF